MNESAPEIVHELLDRAWSERLGHGDIRIYIVARPGERYVAECCNGTVRIATPEMSPHFENPESWERMEREPRPWRKVPATDAGASS